MNTHIEMVKIGRKIFTVCAIFLSCISTSFASGEASIKSYFSSDKIQKNSHVAYVIEVINGTISGTVAVPSVPGLIVQGASTRQEISSINWQTIQKFLYIVRMQPTIEGEIEIPAFDIMVNGEEMTVPAAQLTVTNNPIDPVDTAKSLVFLTVDVPDGEIFVGELVKTKINVFVAEGVKASFLGNNPVKHSENFAEKSIGAPEEQPSFCIIGNKNYRKFSWNIVLLPLKSGEHSIQYVMGIAVWTNDKMPSPTDVLGMLQPFDDAFEKMLSSRKVEISVQNPQINVNVLPLPSDPSATKFTGAVGHFRIESIDVSACQAMIGEPIVLKVVIDGVGNFGTKEPVLADDNVWQVHSPKAHFEQSDELGMSGKKTFEYVLIPQKTGVLKLPSDVQMTFFDPSEKKYVTVSRSIENEVIVARSDRSQVRDVDKQIIQQVSSEITSSMKALELTPLKVKVGNVHRNFIPITHSVLFWLCNFIILICIVIKIWRRKVFIKVNGDTHFAAIHAARLRLGKAIINMERAASYEDIVNFFAFVQYAIRECLSAGHDEGGSAITFEDIDAVMRQKNIPSELLEHVRAIYARGDAIRFGSDKTDDSSVDLKALLVEYKSVIIALRDCAKRS